MNARSLKKIAKEYERQTGMDPVQYAGCAGNTKSRHEALKRDVEWYRVHTEDIAQRLSRLTHGE